MNGIAPIPGSRGFHLLTISIVTGVGVGDIVGAFVVGGGGPDVVSVTIPTRLSAVLDVNLN